MAGEGGDVRGEDWVGHGCAGEGLGRGMVDGGPGFRDEGVSIDVWLRGVGLGSWGVGRCGCCGVGVSLCAIG